MLPSQGHGCIAFVETPSFAHTARTRPRPHPHASYYLPSTAEDCKQLTVGGKTRTPCPISPADCLSCVPGTTPAKCCHSRGTGPRLHKSRPKQVVRLPSGRAAPMRAQRRQPPCRQAAEQLYDRGGALPNLRPLSAVTTLSSVDRRAGSGRRSTCAGPSAAPLHWQPAPALSHHPAFGATRLLCTTGLSSLPLSLLHAPLGSHSRLLATGAACS
jgi:hypothetical protein